MAQGAPLSDRRRLEFGRELGAVTLHDVGMRPALEDAQPGLDVARLAGVQRRGKGARRGLGTVACDHGFLEVAARRLVVPGALRVEPSAQRGLVHRRQRQAGVDHRQGLEDHAVLDGLVALVHLQRQALAVQHLVVEPGAAQRVQLVGIGRAAARGLEDFERFTVHRAIDDDGVQVVRPAVNDVVGREQRAADEQKVQQRLAQPAHAGGVRRGR